jgi:hypothetical protein
MMPCSLAELRIRLSTTTSGKESEKEKKIAYVQKRRGWNKPLK